MAVADIAKGAANSLLGITEKAIIEVEEENFTAGDVNVTATTARSAGSPLSAASGKLAAAASQAASVAQTAASAVPGAAAAVGAVTGGLGLAMPTKKTFKVKFNPSSLMVESKADKIVPKKDMTVSDAVNQQQFDTISHKVQLMVELIFDDYERTDAFMFEKFNDPLALVRTGAMSMFSAPHSVQSQVEGFVAMMRNPKKRKVTFHWGRMSYSGTINMLEAEYNMFSIEGRPIRATVKLGILCADANVKDNQMGQWTAMFNEAFKPNTVNKVTGAVGNVLNVKL